MILLLPTVVLQMKCKQRRSGVIEIGTEIDQMDDDRQCSQRDSRPKQRRIQKVLEDPGRHRNLSRFDERVMVADCSGKICEGRTAGQASRRRDTLSDVNDMPAESQTPRILSVLFDQQIPGVVFWDGISLPVFGI